MQLRLIRNATLVLDYAGHRLLIDPDFAPHHARDSFTGRSRNPMVDLPAPVDEIVTGVELVLVSHLHRDHFFAVDVLPKRLPVLCQPGNEAGIAGHGFVEIRPLADRLEWGGLTFTRTAGHHGLGPVEDVMGPVMGFVLEAPNEPPVYWAGDTVLCDEVRAVIARQRPEVIVVHASGATWPVEDRRDRIVMDAAEVLEVCRLAPEATVIAAHLDSLDHGTVTRVDLRAAAEAAGIDAQRLLIPADGEFVRG